MKCIEVQKLGSLQKTGPEIMRFQAPLAAPQRRFDVVIQYHHFK